MRRSPAHICYNVYMNKHWSVDEQTLRKDPETYAIWKLEQRINWGIGELIMKRVDLLKFWEKIDIDPWRRKALALTLFGA
jgi:hypothetical protein